MKLHRVVVQIYPPTEDGYPGMVEEAHCTVEDGVVTLVNSAGVPINDRYSKAYEKKLPPLGDAHVIAGRLAKEHWQARGGGKRKFSARFITRNWELFDQDAGPPTPQNQLGLEGSSMSAAAKATEVRHPAT